MNTFDCTLMKIFNLLFDSKVFVVGLGYCIQYIFHDTLVKKYLVHHYITLNRIVLVGNKICLRCYKFKDKHYIVW